MVMRSEYFFSLTETLKRVSVFILFRYLDYFWRGERFFLSEHLIPTMSKMSFLQVATAWGCLTLRLKLTDRCLAKVVCSNWRRQTWRKLWSLGSIVRPVRVSPRRAGRQRWGDRGFPGVEAIGRRRREDWRGDGEKDCCDGSQCGWVPGLQGISVEATGDYLALRP